MNFLTFLNISIIKCSSSDSSASFLSDYSMIDLTKLLWEQNNKQEKEAKENTNVKKDERNKNLKKEWL